MRLRAKTLAVVAVNMAAIFGVLFLCAAWAITFYFRSFEERAAVADVARVESALHEEIRRIERVGSDWAVRADIYRFMETRDPRIIDSEVGPESLSNLGVNMVLLMDKSWRPVRTEFADLDLMVRVEPDAATLSAVAAARELARPGDPRWRRSGLLRVGERTLLVSSHSITTSDMYSPPDGTLVVGRYLDKSELDRLSAVTGLEVSAFPVDGGEVPADVAEARASLVSETVTDPVSFVSLSDADLGGYVSVASLDGRPAVVLRALIGRDIYLQGQRGIRYLGVFMLFAGVVATLSVYVVLDRGVLRRLSLLSRQVSTIGAHGDVSARVTDSGSDEIGDLGTRINDMMNVVEGAEEQLTAARDQLEQRVHIRTEELLASEARYRNLIDQMTDAVFAVGLDGRIFLTNARAAEMCGMAPDQLAGVLLPSLMAGSSADEVRRHVDRRQRSAAAWTLEARMGCRADGEAIPVELRASPLIDEAGELVGTQWIARDIAERKRIEQELVRLASHDHLTGLYNRRYFESSLDSELAGMRQIGGRGAVLWLDMDDFKDINDTLGHKAGDEVLLELGGLLRRHVRGSTVLARIGGDEFAVLVPAAEPAEAEAIANRMLLAINSHTFSVRGHALRLSASMGLVLYPEHGSTVEELLAKADVAMYAAKESGAGRVRVHPFDDEGRVERVSHVRWNEQITSALGEGRFLAYAQPILDVKSGVIVRYELLARILGETGAVIQPSEFLPTAERTGLVQEIDRMMVRHAVEIVGAHPDGTFGIEVNLSGKAFGDRGLLPEIGELLRETGIDPGRLGFEITETAAIADVVRAQEFISTLKDLGCRFSLDDFGSGFSSFYYLKHLPIDCLKVDGSFISGLADDEQDQHLVRGMTEMCRGLGVCVAAEYVENAEIMSVVRALDIDYAQGYHIGMPMPVAEALDAGSAFNMHME